MVSKFHVGAAPPPFPPRMGVQLNLLPTTFPILPPTSNRVHNPESSIQLTQVAVRFWWDPDVSLSLDCTVMSLVLESEKDPVCPSPWDDGI